jgi:hypothetical protein
MLYDAEWIDLAGRLLLLVILPLNGAPVCEKDLGAFFFVFTQVAYSSFTLSVNLLYAG